MRMTRRKSTPKVRNGKVQRKNRAARTPYYANTPGSRPVIDRQRPGEGYRHVVTVKQMQQFIDLLPDWEQISQGLRAVVIAPGRFQLMGWCRPTIVAICAWDEELVCEWGRDFVQEHKYVLDRLGVEREPCEDDDRYCLCRFTEVSARGFSLMHVFLHELGHHHDRITSRSKKGFGRGETYAEDYANNFAEKIWDDYFNVFGW